MKIETNEDGKIAVITSVALICIAAVCIGGCRYSEQADVQKSKAFIDAGMVQNCVPRPGSQANDIYWTLP
jgi:hypothetical protein